MLVFIVLVVVFSLTVVFIVVIFGFVVFLVVVVIGFAVVLIEDGFVVALAVDDLVVLELKFKEAFSQLCPSNPG